MLRVHVRGQRDLMTVIGSAASVSAGESIDAHGHWVNDRQHGLQYRAEQLRVVPPSTLEGIEKYLGSGMVKGIGPHFARKLVRVFGEAVFEIIETAIAEEQAAEHLVLDLGLLYLTPLHRSELGCAAHLQRLRRGFPPWGQIDPEKAIPWVEAQTGLLLAPSQREAIKTLLAHKVGVLTGGPGVGKTTLVNSLLRILRAKRIPVLLAAPTGRAAKRLTETTGIEAKTVHRLLELDPATFQFKRDPEDIAAKLYASVTERIPRAFGVHPVEDIQVLAPMNRGGLGVQSINLELQRRLNPDAQPRVQRFGTT